MYFFSYLEPVCCSMSSAIGGRQIEWSVKTPSRNLQQEVVKEGRKNGRCVRWLLRGAWASLVWDPRWVALWAPFDKEPGWQIDGETVETVTDFIFLVSKITADGDCSHEIKRCLLLRRKVMTNLDSIFKSRDNTLLTKVHLVKAMVFPVVMYGCESWIVKKAEHRWFDAFELWCWRRLLRVPWTVRRSNQSILKEISPKCSLEGLMLKLKLQYFGHLLQRADSFEKTLMLGKI